MEMTSFVGNHFVVCFQTFLLWVLRFAAFSYGHDGASREHSPINQDAPVLRSCWELKLGGFTRDGEYMIDPDGPQKGELPFNVYCDMLTGTSIVYHDRQNRGIVPKGFEEKGNYRAPVNYFGATVAQLSGLADVSGNCSQFLSLECQNVLMRWKGQPWSYWISRDGGEMANWGTPTGYAGCKCSMEDGCDTMPDMQMREVMYCYANDTISHDAKYAMALRDVLPGCATTPQMQGVTRCNCDANDGTWRRDTGTITDKRTLPVREMRFGDSQGNQELAIFRLGEFKCTGKDVPLFRSCEDLGKAGFAQGTYLLNNSYSETPAIGELVAKPVITECSQEYEPQSDPPTDMSSCADLRRAGYRTDGIYKIDPDGPSMGVAEFEVQCYLSTNLTPPIMKSCADLMLAGYSINKDYIIDPDGPDAGVEPFVVYCDLTTGTSTVRHNRPPLQQVPFGYEGEGEYRVPVHYDATIEQMIALIDSSRICRQYLSLNCHHVLIWHNDVMITWWVSRDGEKMTNWASETGTVGCACSLTNSCDDQQHRCNCDSNDMIWRKDDGFITDKSKLPVSELRIADTGHLPEQVFYTLGFLECSGMGAYNSSRMMVGDAITIGIRLCSLILILLSKNFVICPHSKKTPPADGKPLTEEDDRPSSTPEKDIRPVIGSHTSECSSKNPAYTGLVVGIILIMIVVIILLVVLFVHWRNYKRVQRSGFIYKSGAI